MVDPRNNVTPENHFDSLLKFLKNQEEIMEKLEQLGASERSEKPEKRLETNYSLTRSTSQAEGCVICRDGRHGEKLFFCKQFKSLKLGGKLNAVKKLGACRRCLECRDEGNDCQSTYLCRNRNCKKGSSSDHHFLLCRKAVTWDHEMDKSAKDLKKRPNTLKQQKQFLDELSPEMAVRCKMAFSNATNSPTKKKSTQTKKKVDELPVIMMLLEVTSNAGQKIATLIDLAPDTNYIAHRSAKRLGLASEKKSL